MIEKHECVIDESKDGFVRFSAVSGISDIPRNLPVKMFNLAGIEVRPQRRFYLYLKKKFDEELFLQDIDQQESVAV